MKALFRLTLFAIMIALASCGQKSNDHEHGHDHDHPHDHAHDEAGPNQALYDEVMKVHDEVMPKMNDIYKLKQELKKQLEESKNLAAEKKQEIENTIAKLDSASDGMMVWMREFDPIPDSLGEERAREYLENEMERVKKVKQDILEAIEKAKN